MLSIRSYLLTIPFRLNKLLGDVVISQGGVVPHIDAAVSVFLDCDSDAILIVTYSSCPARHRRARRSRRRSRSFFLWLLYYLCIISHSIILLVLLYSDVGTRLCTVRFRMVRPGSSLSERCSAGTTGAGFRSEPSRSMAFVPDERLYFLSLFL